jgi:hypothetical protein
MSVSNRLFLNLVWSPHAYGIFELHAELECFSQCEVSTDGDGALV